LSDCPRGVVDVDCDHPVDVDLMDSAGGYFPGLPGSLFGDLLRADAPWKMCLPEGERGG